MTQALPFGFFCHRGFFGMTDGEGQAASDAKGEALASFPPENSEESIRAAYDRGLPVEIDVMATRDGRLIVTHTDDLTAHVVGGVPGDRVSQKTYAELADLRTGRAGKTAPFLLYEKFLEILSGTTLPAIIEIKGKMLPDRPCEPEPLSFIESIVAATPTALSSRIIWSSFSTGLLKQLAQIFPQARLAPLFTHPRASLQEAPLLYRGLEERRLLFTTTALEGLPFRIEAAHIAIESLATADSQEAVAWCARRGTVLRTWSFAERHPQKNPTAAAHLQRVLALKRQYPELRIDLITNYVEEARAFLSAAWG